MLKIISLPFHSVQKFVDSIGMYRLVSGSLFVLAGCSILAGFIGWLPYRGLVQIFALALALLVALALNSIIAFITKIPANHESAVITALILFFLAIPEENIFANWPLVLAVTLAILSKFLITYKKQHFLNPAAFGAALLSLFGIYRFSWWIDNPTLFIPLVILGVLVVMKVRKWLPVLTFIGVSLIIYVAEALSYGEVFSAAFRAFFLSWPTLFLAFYMLTEPFTMPATKESQMLYGGLVGFLSNSSLPALVIGIPPEFALILGNVLMLPWRIRQKLFLTLIEKKKIAKDTYEFIFKKPLGFTFRAGQYLEWMLPHEEVDSRGTRRYFTIASAPTESVVRVALKVVQKGSTYKDALMLLDIGDMLTASQLAGDFLLPKKIGKKLAFIAGGIGVTPFRSHIKQMIDSDKKHDTVLYYCNNTKEDMAYRDVFQQASEHFPFVLVPVISKEEVSHPYESGYISADMVKRRTPDYLERHWYISGPPGMVNATNQLLRELGVPKKHITRDFFPGLA